MARKKKQFPFYEEVEITGVAADGKAVTRVNDLVVFVTGVVPGDIVDIQIFNMHRRFQEGRPVKFHKYAERRAEPFCEHFGVCGGCKWQNLPYEDQLKYKQQQVEDHLRRIGGVDVPEISPIVASENTVYYRNKLEFTFSNKKWLTYEEFNTPDEGKQLNALGFHIPKMFDRVIDINHCYLQAEPSNAIRLAVKEYAFEKQLTFFDIRNQNGFLRNLIIRSSSTGEFMVIVIFYYEDMKERLDLLEYIAEKFPAITSLNYIINTKGNDSVTDQDVIFYKGKDHIIEKMENLNFKIGPKSFYQTNSEQAYRLYCITREFAQLTGEELVYDLYTGTGTIANFVAAKSKKVVGIEYVPEAIEDAKENSNMNNITNTIFFAGDIKDVLSTDFIVAHGRPDVIILDPPRAGLHENVINSILFSEPNRIVYVSCNPATQARDIKMLDEVYKVEKVQPVDMFPHTHHVENVVLLIKR